MDCAEHLQRVQSTSKMPNLKQGLIAQEADIATTTAAVEGGITDNVPRLDYTDSSCPALLLEPQRTNQNNHSEYFGGWTANATIYCKRGLVSKVIKTHTTCSLTRCWIWYFENNGSSSQEAQ